MSCGASKELNRLADKIDGLETSLDLAIDELVGGISDIPAVAFLVSHYNSVKEALNAIENGDFGPLTEALGIQGADSLISDITRAYATYQAGLSLVNDISNLKEKWGAYDVGSINSLDDLEKAFRDGALDVDNICQKINNIKTVATDDSEYTVVFQASPLAFPNVNPKAIIKSGKLPKIVKPQISINVQKKIQEVTNEFGE